MSELSSSGGAGMAPSYSGGPGQKETDSKEETDPEKQTTAYKVAKGLVIVLSALIVLGLLALVAGIAMNLSGKSPGKAASSMTRAQAPAAPAVPATNPTLYQLPPGARIVEMDSQPGRLIVRVQTGGAEEIDIFDTRNGHLVGQVKADSSSGHHDGG